MSKLKELRDAQVGARIKPSAKRIIDESKYSYADAIEYFAFNVLGKEMDDRTRLKNLTIANKQMNYEMCRNQMEIDDIAERLGINPDDDEIFAEDIAKNVNLILNWFERTSYGDIEEFLIIKEKKVKLYADECHLSINQLRDRIVKEYNSRQKKKD